MRRVAAFVLLTAMVGPDAIDRSLADDGSAFSAIMDRPLFDPTRRKPATPPAAQTVATPAAAAAPQRDALLAVLIGIVTGGDRPMALLRDSDGRILYLAAGETIDGWRIVGIAGRTIDLERDGKRQNLSLPRPAGAAL